MNPAFLFNCLSNIQNYMYDSEPVKAGAYLSKFSMLIRSFLENSRQEFISLETEIKSLGYYLVLQKLRFCDNFEYSINVDSALDTENINLPPMLLMPFVEELSENQTNNIQHKLNMEVGIQKQRNSIHLFMFNKFNPGNITRINASQTTTGILRAYEITQNRLRIHGKKSKGNIRVECKQLTKKMGFLKAPWFLLIYIRNCHTGS